jgi:hypothetical protein
MFFLISFYVFIYFCKIKKETIVNCWKKLRLIDTNVTHIDLLPYRTTQNNWLTNY